MSMVNAADCTGTPVSGWPVAPAFALGIVVGFCALIALAPLQAADGREPRMTLKEPRMDADQIL